ncbi:hypothetical protein NQ318_009641 [Aromia moschata]|uniref:Uncharacterized protein n=1 Tax=Aromia moschata TaxID=1265417 RepID=A0AAV8Y901_9CUCU|nr:hypothetical protein NQ318_009641 [Aromia moschata]
MEQRVNLKFLVKLGKTFTEAYAMLKEVLKRDVKLPKTIRTSDGRQRHIVTLTLTQRHIDENIENIGKLIREDRRLSIRRLSEITGIDKECVRHILHESFNMRKNGAKTPHS